MAKSKNSKNKIKRRDVNKLMSLRGEIDLRTKSESNAKKRFTRKCKHKDRYSE